jgi:hypothetical protein
LTRFKQAVLIIRWFLDGTRMTQLAVDTAIGAATSYDYLHEGINALAAQARSWSRRCSRRRWPATTT